MKYRGYLFDLDGTLYRGDTAIDGAVAKVRELHEQGAIVKYVTNNSTQTLAHFTAKLTAMGFPCQREDVMSSAVGSARYLVEQKLKSAFIVGESGLAETLRDSGIDVRTEGETEAVVVGLCRQFTYAWMEEAMTRIRAGAHFVATNPDATYPMEGGRLIPGAGSVVAAVRTCAGIEPFVIGKPKRFLIDEILADAGLKAEETVVVGDRIDTDIESGKAAGCATFLVLTGVETEIPNGQDGAPDLSSLS